ncbi:MAG: hypothetical protein IAE66_01895 [Xanthomonadaceae bacterium]|nr:hypothetical protein [Xanthomonadaceae bacterium]
MSDTKDEAPDTGKWTGKSRDEVQVTHSVSPPLPMEAAAAATSPEPASEPAKPTVITPDSGYAVFFFPAAIEALGAVVSPYLDTGNGEPHLRCIEVDTGGAFIEVTMEALGADGKMDRVELMFPASMVRLIMSVHSDGAFGFARRTAPINY